MQLQSLRLLAYNWLFQFIDPIKAICAPFNLVRYLRDWYKYSRLPGAESLRVIDLRPQLHDRIAKTPFDAHYFWSSGWAMRRIVTRRPAQHVDIGSHTMFVNLLSAVLRVIFVDFRPLAVNLAGLASCGGDILSLPFADSSVESLSCLHVAEHIGLGRYGDRLNPLGTQQACAELQRVLALGGDLYFAVPVGHSRVCFNSHRIHSPQVIVRYFSDLELVEFSGIYDNGQYVERVPLDVFVGSNYACGVFWFRKST